MIKEQGAAIEQNPIHIAFVMPDIELGGVEKALISLLDAIKGQNFKVSLLLLRKRGRLLSSIPGWVDVEEIGDAGSLETIRKFISDHLSRFGAKKLFKICKSVYHKFGSRVKPSIREKYKRFDAVIAFKDGAATWYTAKSELAKLKISFIHTDFKNAGYNPISHKNIYDKFDRIYCSSLASKKNFLSMLPEFSDRTEVMLNIIEPEKIRELAKTGEGFPDEFPRLRILTVGRLSHEKGIDKAIEVVARLKAAKYPIRWYIIGDGTEKDALEKYAAKLHVEEDIVFLGERLNPYRMISECDIYVQPSNYEGYCISLAEARILSRPIVACNFCGALEQLKGGKAGIITGMSVDELYQGVEKLVLDNTLRYKLHQMLLNTSDEINLEVESFCEYIKKSVLIIHT